MVQESVQCLVSLRYFVFFRWIKASTRYVMKHYDTCLPQNDDDQQQRRRELEYKRQMYQYVVNAPGLPVQVKKLPEDECFSDSYKASKLCVEIRT